MKKFFLLTVVAILFASCLPDVNNYYEVDVYTKKFSVTDRMWEVGYDERGDAYLFCEFDLPQLTQEVFGNGMMNAYLYYIPKGLDYEVMSPLPFSDFIVLDNGYKYEEHITAEFGIGSVTFIVKIDDHNVDEVLAYLRHDFIVKIM